MHGGVEPGMAFTVDKHVRVTRVRCRQLDAVQEVDELFVRYEQVDPVPRRGDSTIVHRQAETTEVEQVGALVHGEDAARPVGGGAGHRSPVERIGSFAEAALASSASRVDREPVAVLDRSEPGDANRRMIRVGASRPGHARGDVVAAPDGVVRMVLDAALGQCEHFVAIRFHLRVEPDVAGGIEIEVGAAIIVGVGLGVVKETDEFVVHRLEARHVEPVFRSAGLAVAGHPCQVRPGIRGRRDRGQQTIGFAAGMAGLDGIGRNEIGGGRLARHVEQAPRFHGGSVDMVGLVAAEVGAGDDVGATHTECHAEPVPASATVCLLHGVLNGQVGGGGLAGKRGLADGTGHHNEGAIITGAAEIGHEDRLHLFGLELAEERIPHAAAKGVLRRVDRRQVERGGLSGHVGVPRTVHGNPVGPVIVLGADIGGEAQGQSCGIEHDDKPVNLAAQLVLPGVLDREVGGGGLTGQNNAVFASERHPVGCVVAAAADASALGRLAARRPQHERIAPAACADRFEADEVIRRRVAGQDHASVRSQGKTVRMIVAAAAKTGGENDLARGIEAREERVPVLSCRERLRCIHEREVA